MKATLYGGPLDGQEVDVPDPSPPYVQVETRQRQVRRVHTYALRDGRYEFMGTVRRGPLPPLEEQDED